MVLVYQKKDGSPYNENLSYRKKEDNLLNKYFPDIRENEDVWYYLITGFDNHQQEPIYDEISVVNGPFANITFNRAGDTFLIVAPKVVFIDFKKNGFQLIRLGSVLSNSLISELNSSGINGLLNIKNQENLKEGQLYFDFWPNEKYNYAQQAIDKGIPDFEGSLGVYFREIFFHIPFSIANHLNSQGKYADAQRWYHYIFDPTSTNAPNESDTNKKDRVWQYVEFRNRTLKTFKERLNDPKALEAYTNDPFNPFAIARHRFGAFMKSVVMKYIDNLLDWGDHLFARDTVESINEASLLYVMAQEILGPKPQEISACKESTRDPFEMSYQQIKNRISAVVLRVDSEKFNLINTWPFKDPIEKYGARPIFDPGGDLSGYFESKYGHRGINSPLISNNYQNIIQNNTQLTVDNSSPIDENNPMPEFASSFLNQAKEFCVLPNKELMKYWDRVDDRLFKIRNCMNLSGVRRQLACLHRK